MELPNFCGGSDPMPSVNVNGERAVNLYPEKATGPNGQARLINRSVAGITPYCVLPAGPIRGAFELDGRCFWVGGNRLFETFGNRTGIQRGIVALDGNMASLCSNGSAGNQLVVTSGGSIYTLTLSTNTFAVVADGDAPSPCVQAVYSDTFIVGLVGRSRRIQWSSPEDATAWDGLDVAEVSNASDNLHAIGAAHKLLWLFGSEHTHVYYFNGTTYIPMGGVLISHGILAPWSLTLLDNTWFLVTRNEAGDGIVSRFNGYTPERISTHSIEYQLKRTGQLAQTSGWAYQEQGHSFYMLYIPGAETLWAYDVATGLWHERGPWDQARAQYTPLPGRCHVYFDGKHLIGDPESGAIYEMSNAFKTNAIVNVTPSQGQLPPTGLIFDENIFDTEIFR